MRKWGLLSFLLLACNGDYDGLALADGGYARLSHWEGRWLVVNYWAEWCAPCRREIPELNQLHKERVTSNIVILGVNYDGLRDDNLREVIERMDIKFPVLASDPREMWGYKLPTSLPTTVIISPDREVQAILLGPQSRESIELAVGAVTQT